MNTVLGPVSAVIFDMDGVLIDSEPIYSDAMFAACDTLGYELTDELRLAMIGMPLSASNQMLMEAFGPAFPLARFDDIWRAQFEQRMRAGVPLKPGVRQLLDALRANAIPRAVATSTVRVMASAHLAEAGLLPLFDGLITRDDVTNGKPHPEPFLRAAELLGMAPEACVAVEDSYNGIRSAHAAGMRPVMVPDLLPPTDEIRALTAAIVPDLSVLQADILQLA